MHFSNAESAMCYACSNPLQKQPGTMSDAAHELGYKAHAVLSPTQRLLAYACKSGYRV